MYSSVNGARAGYLAHSGARIAVVFGASADDGGGLSRNLSNRDRNSFCGMGGSFRALYGVMVVIDSLEVSVNVGGRTAEVSFDA